MKVFSRKKYMRERLDRTKDMLDIKEVYGYPNIVEIILQTTLDSYVGWAKECDQLSIEEAKNLGYDVDFYEWLEDK